MKRLRLISPVVLASLGLFVCSVKGQGAQGGIMLSTNPLAVQTRLVNDTVSLGEPVVMDYTMTNTVRVELEARIGLDEPEWCDVEIRRAEGGTVPRRVLIPAEDEPLPGVLLIPQGGPETRTITLFPGKSVTRKLVLSYWFDLTEPGLYEVSARIHMRYGTREHSGGVFKDEQTHLLEVLPRNTSLLRQALGKLDRQFETATRVDQEWIRQALVSIPEADAKPLWTKWATRETDIGKASDFIEELARLGSSVSVDVLGQVAWDRRSGSTRPRQLLQQVARKSLINLGHRSPAVKPDVQRLFIEHEGISPKGLEPAPE